MNRSFLGREGRNEDWRYITTTQTSRISTAEVRIAQHKFCRHYTDFIANVFSSATVFYNFLLLLLYISVTTVII